MSGAGFTRVLGIDPGSTEHGWAVLDVSKSMRCKWLSEGHSTLEEMQQATFGRIDLVAIERPSGYVHEQARGAELLNTSFQAGRIYEWACKLVGADKVVCLSAEQARSMIAKKATTDDAVVRAALQLFLDLPEKSNVHERDAAAAALAGWMRHGSAQSVATFDQAIKEAIGKAKARKKGAVP